MHRILELLDPRDSTALLAAANNSRWYSLASLHLRVHDDQPHLPAAQSPLENLGNFGYHRVVSEEDAGAPAPPERKGDKPSGSLAARLTFAAAVFGGIVAIVVALLCRGLCVFVVNLAKRGRENAYSTT